MSVKKQSKIFNSKDVIAYFLVAGTGAVIQLVSSSLLQDWFNLEYGISIVYSYLIGLVVGFVLTKLFAFNARKTNQTRREMVKFFMVALFSMGVTYVFSVGSFYLSKEVFHIPIREVQIPGASKDVNINQMACYIIGMGFSFMSNYILHKTFTFKSTGFYDRLKVLIR